MSNNKCCWLVPYLPHQCSITSFLPTTMSNYNRVPPTTRVLLNTSMPYIAHQCLTARYLPTTKSVIMMSYSSPNCPTYHIKVLIQNSQNMTDQSVLYNHRTVNVQCFQRQHCLMTVLSKHMISKQHCPITLSKQHCPIATLTKHHYPNTIFS